MVTEVAALSPRLSRIVEALPLDPGMRVIEIGCGPGAAVRAVADRVDPNGHVLAIDRSACLGAPGRCFVLCGAIWELLSSQVAERTDEQ